ncbi:uncharacterized protein N7482_006794 [Penicillium canariense]|uniref:Uncharacterized protein n=1 Tax=Penicillium canariense TaxID=189055 RepID=A0A9W9I0B7_9EURO|nr:uncharacterized protein N7482_006794 [Penicillium canariense]KAJ5159790.1 hypothetical protein N7482_006794 [Penicillium canariense]
MASTNGTHLEEGGSSPHRILLVSVPRTASNLLLKVMNIHNQPKVFTNERAGYSFDDAFVSVTNGERLVRPICQWMEPEKREVQSALQTCLDKLEEGSALARKAGKIYFNKEHGYEFANPASVDKILHGNPNVKYLDTFRLRAPLAYGTTQTFGPLNETVLPDEYLRTWRISFIIRHPALAWPSGYRSISKMAAAGTGYLASKELQLITKTFHWTRILYDWCLEQPGVSKAPPVLDAHDLIHSPQVVRLFCEQIGLDTSVLQYEWGQKDPESKSESQTSVGLDSEDDREVKRFAIALSTLKASNGILKSKAPESINVATEVEKWKTEFGFEVAAMIEKSVWESMSDYEYLKARRVTV